MGTVILGGPLTTIASATPGQALVGRRNRGNCVGWRTRSWGEPMQLSKGVSLWYQALVVAVGQGRSHYTRWARVVKRILYWVKSEASDGRDCDTTCAILTIVSLLFS